LLHQQRQSAAGLTLAVTSMIVRLRYALLLAIAAIPLLDVGEVKPAPLAIAIALFAVHGLLSLVTRSAERFWPRDVLSAALWLGCFVGDGTFLGVLLPLPPAPPGEPRA